MLQYSLIICTYNRSAFLKETIDSILNHFEEHDNYELVIIDNNSPDNTAEVVQAYLGHPQVHYFLEKEQGLSHARNRGIKEAQHEILVFLDDDIDIDPQFLKRLSSLYGSSSISIVGGKVLPYGIEVPDWLPLRYYYLASIFDLGDEAKQTDKLMGANYSMRRTVAEKTGWYNTALGRKGNSLAGGEEVDYLNRARDNGYTIWYDPHLVVYHKIGNKLNQGYIYAYANNLGQSEFIIDFQNSKIKTLLKLGKAFLMILIFQLTGAHWKNPKKKTFIKINELYSRGYLNAFRLRLLSKA